MIQEHLRTTAYNCGAIPYTQGPMRAVTGVSFTYEQLQKFAEQLTGGSRAQLAAYIAEYIRYELDKKPHGLLVDSFMVLEAIEAFEGGAR
jgi:hypothetical protein